MPPDARAHRRRCRAITQADPLVTIRYGRLELGAASPMARAPRAHARRAAFLRHQWAYSRRPWSGSAAREQLRELAAAAWIRRRFAPHELRHAHAVEIAGEGVPLNVIQRQLGHYAGDRVNSGRAIGDMTRPRRIAFAVPISALSAL